MTAEQFLSWPNKAITLLGMSGVGKTTLAHKLPKSHWFHYSGDYRIGTKYLDEPILDNIKREAMQVKYLRDLLRSDSIYIASNITIHNLAPVASFLGKIGSPDRGGLPVAEFKRRQALHRDAEIGAMRDVVDFIRKAKEIYDYDHFINDAGGSLCELDDAQTLETLARHTVILYLRADEDLEQQVIQRAIDDPKPMYYHSAFLDAKLADYLQLRGLQSPGEIDPDDFVRWVFRALLEYRKPKYQAIADAYGYTVDAKLAATVRSERDFLALVAGVLSR